MSTLIGDFIKGIGTNKSDEAFRKILSEEDVWGFVF